MKKCTLRMFGKVMLTLILCCGISTLKAQDLAWAKFLDGPQGYELGSAVATDASGNTYIGGTFSGTTDFDPGTGVQNLTPAGWDMFLLKLDADGNFEWVKHFVGSDYSALCGLSKIVLDATGNIYLEGYFSTSGGTIDFDPGTGTLDMGTTGGGQNTDVFVLKLNASGTLSWAKQLGGSEEDQSSSMSLDNNGNLLITGNFKGTADFNPGTATNNFTALSPYGDVFICKLNNSGEYVWAKRLGGSDATRSQSIRTDLNGYVYTMGTFQGTVDFDPGAGTQNLSTELSPLGWSVTNIFISKLDSNGNYAWAKNLAAPYNINTQWAIPTAMSVDAFGNIYTTGAFTDSVDFDPGTGADYLVSASAGNADIFITKMDTAGNYIWTKGMGGFSHDVGWRIETDNQGNVYTLGDYKSPVDFDPSDTGVYELIPATAQGGMFLSKLDSTGSFKWARSIDGAGMLDGVDLCFNAFDNSIRIVSSFTGLVDFDPGPGTANLTGSSDVFIVKLNNCNTTTSVLNETACDIYTLNGITYTESGSYQQTHVTAGGCDSIITLNLEIQALPVAAITQTGGTLNATQSGLAYQWIDCGNGNSPINGATAQSFTPASNGSYAVIIIQNNCKDTSACFAVTGLKINNSHNENQLQAFPNPTGNNITLTVSKPLINASYKVVNILGQTIKEGKQLNGHKFIIELGSATPGVYMLEVNESNKTFHIKLIRE